MKTLVAVRSDTGTDMNPVVDCASGMLAERGFRVMRYAFSPGSPCITATYPASGIAGAFPGGKLILHCHLDTAAFREPDWKTDPLGAEEIDGRIFGRGTLDCKGLAAVWISILGRLKSRAVAFPFDIVFVAVSDEERDGAEGTAALLESTKECDNAFLAIGEGGGYPLRTVSGVYMTMQTGEMDQTVAQANTGRAEFPTRIGDYVRCFRNGTFGTGTTRYAIESSVWRRKGLRRLAYSPFETRYEEDGLIHRLPASSPGVPRYVLKAVKNSLRRIDRRMKVLPVVSRGHCDNRHFRNRGIPAIGFFPLAESNSLNGCHAANEYVTLDSLRFAEEVLESTINNIREAIRG